ncbi:outer membrane lipoprotein-sorting protein [Paraburkholderia fungorum]|uniref:outer membrane lipoprotein-sorting protein n=1 Tax=Paraburkholderia fungorum TaxID=134537 RepID=UPI00402B4576
MMMKYGLWLLWLAVGVYAPLFAHAQPDATALLKLSDRSRGGDMPGLVWDVYVSNSGSGADDTPPQRLHIRASDTSSLALVLEPLNSKGAQMLQVARNMWMMKPGLRKPVAISPRQRLTGQAAIGDIAATNYARDYEATYVRDDNAAGEPCYVLALKALGSQATYEKIVYWVSVRRGVAVKAEFQSLSGKPLKSATFEYGNSIVVDGKTIPFVSRMSIADQLTDARTSLEYSHVRVQSIPSSEFDVSNL